nr:sigma 54-interacting transcriptional regulator [Candidatus Krumholzibacteria bacterium]
MHRNQGSTMTQLYDATRDLRDLATLAIQPAARQKMLTRALDSLNRLVPHDLAAVLELDEGTLRVLASHGSLANAAILDHRLELARFPSIQKALETRRPVILEEHDHAGDEGDPYDGVVDLPHGHSCMVVPLYSGDRTLGLMTFDRTVCGTYDETTIALADVYGQIISLAFLYAEQAELLDRYRQRLDERNRVLAQSQGGPCAAVEKLARSRSGLMINLGHQAQQVAQTTAPVLIQGETGTGKEVLAQAIHCWSDRRDQTLLTLNCAAIPETLIESELFGHVKGAFSGADKARPGRFLAANGGTLLLDEIGDMPLQAQAKLLRVLQEGTFQPVGSDHTVKVDVRILASTHRDLDQAVAEGKFREDLYYRLNVFPLYVPALRDRSEDTVPLAENILADMAARTGRGPWTLAAGARRELEQQEWPGNIRQLVNALERATILKPRGTLELHHVAVPSSRRAPVLPAAGPATAEGTPILPLQDMERQYIGRALEATGGKIYGQGGAAELLGLKPTTLQSRMKKLGVKRP